MGPMARRMILPILLLSTTHAHLTPRLATPSRALPLAASSRRSRLGTPRAVLPTLPVGLMAFSAMVFKPAAVATTAVGLKSTTAIGGTAAAAAAAAAAGASSNIALPNVNTLASSSMTANQQGPRMRAVVRILEVELERLITALQLSVRRYAKLAQTCRDSHTSAPLPLPQPPTTTTDPPPTPNPSLPRPVFSPHPNPSSTPPPHLLLPPPTPDPLPATRYPLPPPPRPLPKVRDHAQLDASYTSNPPCGAIARGRVP